MPTKKRMMIPVLLLSLLGALGCAARGSAGAKEPTAKVDTALLHEMLAARRQLQIQRLRDYKDAVQFPRNRVRPGLVNIWIDEDGRLCAVANLIDKDGLHALVQKQAKDDNLVRVAALDQGAIIDWLLESGLTKEEAVLIQEPYMYPGDFGWEQEEDQRLIQHFENVEAQLLRETDASLDLAVQRLAAKLAAAA